MNPIFADFKSLKLHQRGYRLVAVPAVLGCELDNTSSLLFTVRIDDFFVALSGSELSNHPAGQPLRYTQLVDDMLNGLTFACRAQKFPEATSFKIEISTA